MRILGLLLALALPAAAHADIANVIAESDRIVQGARPVEVILASPEIQVSTDVGRVASSANGGGLLGALIISSMDDKRKVLEQTARSKAEATVGPLRAALRGFDVEALARATTRTALTKPGWFQASFGSLPATANARQSVTVIYRYETSPDFTQIRVLADIRLNALRSSSGTSQRALIYRQTISSIAVLRQPSFEPSENVEKWSAEDGKLAKAALTGAFARVEELIPFALELKSADVKEITAKGRPKVFGGGFYGPALERAGATAGETLLWKDGLVSVTQVAN